MVRLTCDRSGWGTVRDPDTDERISLDAEVEPDVAHRLASEYGPVELASDTDADADSGSDETDESDVDESEGSAVNDDVADDLLDEHWKSIENQILAGSADGDLDDLEAAEQRRDRPRSSVLSAIETRKEELGENVNE